jgi:hypothetical protein
MVGVSEQQTRAAVREALASVRPLVTLSRDGLVVQALTWGADHAPSYETATAATAKGDLVLREQDGGSVPTVEAVTKGTPVVIFAGDSIIGGRQNRVINVTVWLPPAKVTPIPVSCLEAGRWNQGSWFGVGRKVDYLMRSEVGRHVEARARDEMAANVAVPASARRRPSYSSDQGAVWSEIAGKEERAGLHSPTSALHDLYEREAPDLEAFARAFPCPDGSNGLAVEVGGHLVALDLFDAAATLKEQWPRLVESAVSAHFDYRRMVAAGLEPEPRHRHPDEGALARLLTSATAALDDAVLSPSVGEGTDLRLRGRHVQGGVLVVGDYPVHVELFRAE